MAQKEIRSILELSVLSKTSPQPAGSCKCPGNNHRGHYRGEIRYNHRDVTPWTRSVAVLVPFVWCHAQLHRTLPQSRCCGLTFRNWGVTNRTVAIRQTCSSSDACRLRGNDSSSPLQEEVGTASEKTFSSNADHQTLRAVLKKCSPFLWNLKSPTNLTYSYTGVSFGSMLPLARWQQNSICASPKKKKRNMFVVTNTVIPVDNHC